MDIVWFESGLKAGDHSKKDRALVDAWVRDHEEDISSLSRLAEESEIEAVKIITGTQEINGEGEVAICTLEVRFMKGLILIERVEAVQGPGSYVTKGTSTQLGYLEAPCSCGCCRTPSPKT